MTYADFDRVMHLKWVKFEVFRYESKDIGYKSSGRLINFNQDKIIAVELLPEFDLYHVRESAEVFYLGKFVSE